jgi:uncharacterized protein YpmB
MSFWILFIVVIGVIAILFVYSLIEQNKIKKDGILTDAEVSSVDVSESTDTDGTTSYTRTYYVTYRNREGHIIEAVLINPKKSLREGNKVKIKYLPKKPRKAILIDLIEI